METRAKKKTPQLYSTMQGESSIQEYSKPPEDLQESTPQVEDPQDDMEKDKSSELNDFVSAIKALGKNAAKSGKVREPEPINGWDPKKLKTFVYSVAFTSEAPPTCSKTRPVVSPLRYPISGLLL